MGVNSPYVRNLLLALAKPPYIKSDIFKPALIDLSRRSVLFLPYIDPEGLLLYLPIEKYYLHCFCSGGALPLPL